jgi:phosphoribosylanthranilate isomerase
MKVKICGITNYDDAMYATEYGADALGFVFYEKSPRFIDAKVCRQIVDRLPPFIHKVGLFVNKTSKEIDYISKRSGITLAQIHFEASCELYKELSIPHIKVSRVKTKDDISRYKDEYRIVDAFVKSYGGEGKSIAVEWFKGIDTSKIILAGGLNYDNIKSLTKYNFYGFDVSSGVERSKGKKDRILMKNFIETAKNANT